MNAPISINGNTAEVQFGHYDLDSYSLFPHRKALPESQITYDWERHLPPHH